MLCIQLHDGKHATPRPWPPMPLVIQPKPAASLGPWLLRGRDHPGLLQRFDEWLAGKLEVDVWVGGVRR